MRFDNVKKHKRFVGWFHNYSFSEVYLAGWIDIFHRDVTEGGSAGDAGW